ncbi:putative nucleoside transporter protein [Thermochaetoides thermophila DSM 1495]|uniref:Putative nucleoside transporter protein n=1 Tax=Chaetomium thermophilum (strain DSM 1495 / CBS 144.50 / IMI 039719) TaxID=759272 RepID=G0S5M8_CHATD|nr:putative nucleoside transporter protein [Thermochaetoides thermophila DSM 1495]EGS20647.1 putative nucleoside transporter protein [Thermochaetoides thermophila DSM 1495]
MERLRTLFTPSKPSPGEYQRLDEEEADIQEGECEEEVPFSWAEYFIFVLIGVAMLWSWNMFLAAAPYFYTRFQSNPWILANSQSSILTTSTIVNLISVLVLTNMQSGASYPFRIILSLLANAVIFALLAISTTTFLGVPAPMYLAFVLLMVALAAWAAGLMQNGAFAFAASFGRTEYTQGIMAGQGIAGILPPLTQMLSYLAFTAPSSADDQPTADDEPADPSTGSTAAFIYFLTAVLISAITLAAFIPLMRRQAQILQQRAFAASLSPEPITVTTPLSPKQGPTRRKHIGILTLLAKLHWLAGAIFLSFATSMFFPVFTGKILSVHDNSISLFSPGAFIPLGFFAWNLGDLSGRVVAALPFATWHRLLRCRHPAALFAVSVARTVFLPFYLLCNLHGKGAVVESDLFYLAVVQFPFGLTNGWLGASAMMAAAEWVDEEEREATGAFMGLCIVSGLAVGSVLSFTAAGI